MIRRILAKSPFPRSPLPQSLRPFTTSAPTPPHSSAHTSTAPDSSTPHTPSSRRFDVAANDYRTQRPPVYRLPFLDLAPGRISALPEETVTSALKLCGGFVEGSREERVERLVRAVSVSAKRCITGTVVSTKMDKSVVVSARRMTLNTKLNKRYYRRRKYMAHDEQDLCREGDVVTIQECRPLSKRKFFFVRENFGNVADPEEDQRTVQM